MLATAVTSLYPTIFVYKDILKQYIVAKFALQAAIIALSPLRVPVVLTTNLFILSEIFDYLIKSVLMLSSIGIQRQLFVDGLICHIGESFLIPKKTIVYLLYLTTDIAELISISVKIEY